MSIKAARVDVPLDDGGMIRVDLSARSHTAVDLLAKELSAALGRPINVESVITTFVAEFRLSARTADEWFAHNLRTRNQAMELAPAHWDVTVERIPGRRGSKRLKRSDVRVPIAA